MPWIILDRDGVINYDSDDYIKSAEEWRALPGSIEAICALKKAGYNVAVATNQSGLARGLFDLDDLEAMHSKLQRLLAEYDANTVYAIDAIFYCPHLPEDDCACRKPKTGLLDALEKEFEVSLAGSWLVGDHVKDIELALAKQCKPALVLTGKGKTCAKLLAENPPLSNTPVFNDLLAFTTELLTKDQLNTETFTTAPLKGKIS